MLDEIVRDAVLKFAVSTTRTTSEAAAFLGMNQDNLWKLIKKYGIWNYFEPIYYRKPRKKKGGNITKTSEE